MAASAETIASVKKNRMFSIYQPALDESLGSFEAGERLLLEGLANVGNCDGYYLITDRGIHYCDSEKAGMFRKRYVARFFPKNAAARAVIDQIGPPQYSYLRIYNDSGKMAIVMQFEDEFSDAPSRVQAERAARALGLS